MSPGKVEHRKSVFTVKKKKLSREAWQMRYLKTKTKTNFIGCKYELFCIKGCFLFPTMRVRPYQVLVRQSSCRPLHWRQRGRSSRWRTERRRSPCGQSSQRSCRIWRRWPRHLPWWPAGCWGCRWRPESSVSGGPSCWWRCCWPSGWRRRTNDYCGQTQTHK